MLSKLRVFPDKQHRAIWKTFGSSILLLTAAMVSALYSSSATRDGRLVAAGISAGLALIVAFWVGIRFVPRLAANVDWDWLPFLSRYQITREGWLYFGAITIVIFAAINTSNNLLYMVLSALLAVLLLSGFLSGLNFRLIRLEARIPPHCFAGEAFSISIQVHNDKRVFPSFSLELHPPPDSAFQYSSFYMPIIRPLESVHRPGQAMLTRRGRYAVGKMKGRSRYPFGFFVKERGYEVDGECICYPEIIPLEQLDLPDLDADGWRQRFERGVGYDLYTIRDYVPSDSTRHVHWKASAKTATLKTREYAADESRRVLLAFDRFGGPADVDRFERVVSYAATTAYHLLREGIEVALVSDEWRTGFGNSEAVLGSILEYLALVEMSAVAAAPGTFAPSAAVVISLRG
jgi:uncharacterized protein (DUF58 family)